MHSALPFLLFGGLKAFFHFSKKAVLVMRRPRVKGQEDKAELEKSARLPLHWSQLSLGNCHSASPSRPFDLHACSCTCGHTRTDTKPHVAFHIR